MMSAMTNTPSTLTLYGIANCSTVKKARAWLDAQGQPVQFVDFKKLPPTAALLAQWLHRHPWETLLNRKGTTWRQLPQDVREGVHDAATATALMGAHPSLIKRPITVWPDGTITVGFDEATFHSRLPT